MKNWEPLVLGPPLAIAMRPLELNFMRRFCETFAHVLNETLLIRLKPYGLEHSHYTHTHARPEGG